MNCEEVQMAAMAAADGESVALDEKHLQECTHCRAVVEAMMADHAVLARAKRRPQVVDAWPTIQARLTTRRWPFLTLPALLIVFKLVEFVPERQWSDLVQIIPVAIAFLVFRALKDNPFHINPNLRLEGEKS